MKKKGRSQTKRIIVSSLILAVAVVSLYSILMVRAADSATLMVYAPNNGQQIVVGTKYNIEWRVSTSEAITTATVQLLKAGQVVQTIATLTGNNTSNGSISYIWSVPTGTPLGTDYRIRVQAHTASGLDLTDDSDTDFSLVGSYALRCTTLTRLMQSGASSDLNSGGEVSALQSFLITYDQSHGGTSLLGSDAVNYFGDITARDLRNFQAQNGLPQTGQTDPATISKIHDISCGVVSTGPHSSILNGGFEAADTNWQAFGNSTTAFSRVAVPHTGSYGIKLTNDNLNSQTGASQRIDLKQTTLKPVFIGGWVKGDNIQMQSGSWLGASLYAEIYLANGTVVYWNSVPNSGTFDWRWIGFNAGTLPGVTGPIDHIFIVPILGNATGNAYFDDITAQEFTPTQGAVTLMFDDGESSTFTEGVPALRAKGFAGTAAIPTADVGTDDHMTWDQINTLSTQGWEIVSHSVDHVSLLTLPPDQEITQLSQSKQILQSHNLAVNNYALPEGAYNGFIMGEGQKYYRSIRAFELGDNPQGVFPYDVKVQSVVNTVTAAQVASWLSSAKQNNRWVVLVFHSIRATGDDMYHTSPDVFRNIIQSVANSGLPVVTYNQGLDRFAVTQ